MADEKPANEVDTSEVKDEVLETAQVTEQAQGLEESGSKEDDDVAKDEDEDMGGVDEAVDAEAAEEQELSDRPEGTDQDPADISDLKAEYDPLLDATKLRPITEQREKSLKELLEAMDDYAPIIPDAVTDYYLAKSGFKTGDQRVKRLLALATQKFVSDIANDAYQFSRIRTQAGSGAAGNPARGRLGANPSRTVLTMEDLSNVLTEYGINARRPDFYR